MCFDAFSWCSVTLRLARALKWNCCLELSSAELIVMDGVVRFCLFLYLFYCSFPSFLFSLANELYERFSVFAVRYVGHCRGRIDHTQMKYVMFLSSTETLY